MHTVGARFTRTSPDGGSVAFADLFGQIRQIPDGQKVFVEVWSTSGITRNKSVPKSGGKSSPTSAALLLAPPISQSNRVCACVLANLLFVGIIDVEAKKRGHIRQPR